MRVGQVDSSASGAKGGDGTKEAFEYDEERAKASRGRQEGERGEQGADEEDLPNSPRQTTPKQPSNILIPCYCPEYVYTHALCETRRTSRASQPLERLLCAPDALALVHLLLEVVDD